MDSSKPTATTPMRRKPRTKRNCARSGSLADQRDEIGDEENVVIGVRAGGFVHFGGSEPPVQRDVTAGKRDRAIAGCDIVDGWHAVRLLQQRQRLEFLGKRSR